MTTLFRWSKQPRISGVIRESQRGTYSMEEGQGQGSQAWNRFIAGLCVGLAISAIAVSIILWYVQRPIPPPTPTVKITALQFSTDEFTNLESEVGVPREITVVGESRDVPNNWHIWICVLSIDVVRYYPQREPIQPNANWELTDVYIGVNDSGDIGKRFIVCVVLANDDASGILYQYAQEIFAGMVSLPDGAAIYDQVIVIRAR